MRLSTNSKLDRMSLANSAQSPTLEVPRPLRHKFQTLHLSNLLHSYSPPSQHLHLRSYACHPAAALPHSSLNKTSI
jgi:hypothetical protein